MRWHVGGSAPTFWRESELAPRNQTEKKKLKSSGSLHVMVAEAMATLAEGYCAKDKKVKFYG